MIVAEQSSGFSFATGSAGGSIRRSQRKGWPPAPDSRHRRVRPAFVQSTFASVTIPPRDPEQRRLASLHSYAVLDTPAERTFDEIAALAAEVCETPIALITLLDATRQWFKAKVGVFVAQTPREQAFCVHALAGTEVMLVPDATRDARFAAHPMVCGEPHIRFYAGAPLVSAEGEVLGALCVIDHVPRTLSDRQLRVLQCLGRQVMTELTLRRELREHRRAVAQLARAQAVSKVGSWETHLSTREMSWSAETHRIFGTDPDTFLPTHAGFLERVHPDDRAAVDQALVQSLSQSETNAIAHRILLPDGAIKFIEERWQVLADDDGRPARSVGTCRDITAERQTQAAMRLQVEMLDHIGEAVIATDTTGRIIHANRFASELYGWTQVEMLGRGILEVTAPQTTPAQAAEIMVQMERGESWSGEYLVQNRHGRVFPALVMNSPLLDGRRQLAGIIGISRDITVQKQAEEAQRRMAELLATTLESVTDGFFTLDREWRFTYVNAAAERMILRDRKNLLGVSMWAAFPEGVGTVFEREYRRALTDHETVSFEEYFPPLAKWFEIRAYPSAEGLAVYVRDVTASRQVEQALRTSEERLREMAENIGDFFYSYDPALGRLLYGTAAFAQLWGRPLADAYANPQIYLEGVHPDDRPAAEAAFRRQLDGLETDTEFRIVRPDGSVRCVRERAVPVRSEAGRVERIVGTVRDITERRLASDRLRASAEQYRLLFAGNPHPMWVFDRQTLRFLAVNAAAIAFYGYTEAEFLGLTVMDIRPAEDAAEFREALARLPMRGKDFGHRRHRKKDGTVVEMEVLADGLEFNGRAARLVLAQDVTERRRAEAKLREQAALLDKARDAILVRDLEHRITFWNKSAERLYGWTAAEVLGRRVRELLYFDPAIFDQVMIALLAEGEWTGELLQMGKDGRKLDIEGRWTLVRDDQGRPQSVLAINTDITERKKLEKQFLRAQRMESIGTLAGGIAHDLNNLLAPVTMGVELLRMNELNPKSQLVIDNIERSARRGANLVKQVLSFARGVEGSRVPLQFRHIVREIEDIVENTFPKNIAFESRIAPNLWPFVGDPTQINQVLLNLCVNARDALPEGGQLLLRASNAEVDAQYAVMNRGVAAGHYIVIEVTDNGTGIPPAVIDRIFEPFFTTKPTGKGTGLGLSTVLAIVRSHGGFVNVYSEPEQGSTFKVYLPAQPDAALAGSASPFEEKLPRGAGELILVVDDEAPILNVTRQTLEVFGYRVLVAEDGAQAISRYALHRAEIALVLTDMMMPVMDGPALIAALRRIDPHVRIIAASGLSAHGNMARASVGGVRHFLPKPYSTDTMLSVIKEALAGAPGAPPARPPA